MPLQAQAPFWCCTVVMLAVLIIFFINYRHMCLCRRRCCISGFCCRMQGGILSIDAAPGSESLIATAGADGVVVLFDRDAGRIRASLTGHTKKVNGESICSSVLRSA